MYRTSVKLAVAAALGVIAGCDQPPARVAAPSTSSLGSAALADDPLLKRIKAINASLAAQGLNIAIEAIEFYTIGLGRPSARLHQAGDRWVPSDPRRLAQGIDITYLVDLSDGATASGLTSAQTQTAIDAAMTTWETGRPLRKVDVVKRTDTGADPDIFDFFFGFGGFGNPFLADIVHAGWLPRAFFEAVFGPGGGTGALAFSVIFVFVNGNGVPTDVNGDRYLDTALAEVYYNDNFGNPAGDRPGFPWVINLPLPGIDVQTVALHESGHGFGLGHFGAPPIALMNPAYRGILQSPLPPDNAGMFALWASWPNP